ncbi:hypothetical protein BT96DRAFT_912863 [Gymnopus androsaceus JB14]|uniref:Uncharacterized protein n=1 Tax=Gymnopus androsaceus JB14 TaxID=1447944 RepID=A0A6A4IHC0_9AGAR|nr:hypothetical protein BT96DRAFT_912863 [Gymnopus androsaceus JB14]
MAPKFMCPWMRVLSWASRLRLEGILGVISFLCGINQLRSKLSQPSSPEKVEVGIFQPRKLPVAVDCDSVEPSGGNPTPPSPTSTSSNSPSKRRFYDRPRLYIRPLCYFWINNVIQL